MENVLKMPAISECEITGGFDEAKGKSFITLYYDGIAITEYYEDNPSRFHPGSSEKVQRQVNMTQVARRARHRLGVALAARCRKISGLQ